LARIHRPTPHATAAPGHQFRRRGWPDAYYRR
jgi:hypothetical protein